MDLSLKVFKGEEQNTHLKNVSYVLVKIVLPSFLSFFHKESRKVPWIYSRILIATERRFEALRALNDHKRWSQIQRILLKASLTRTVTFLFNMFWLIANVTNEL